MGERGARDKAATDEDIEKMAEIVQEGIAACALGFSTPPASTASTIAVSSRRA
ncbi:hypothetical protein [Parvibaculum sp.]|jgi:N-acyl-D-aspartate/D-glutamate deacylase|uniref:hypothetical protein n=1 Tax=Parvibaculum sp. TaxID=2024848 RepID=UPI001B22E488|nr:hypothetical protein [Parvibaculum sp.]MBO6680018.1 hypothetical protein [Parvibaculum sp.]MBO6683654.1 hypothetical protein [Parvibaculum sp.]MBO6905338.1 hypothetical protein [Parvibaculum sp.]